MTALFDRLAHWWLAIDVEVLLYGLLFLGATLIGFAATYAS